MAIIIALLIVGAAGCDSSPPPALADLKAGPEEYAGSQGCAECHEEAYEKWKGSHHAGAQRGLVADLDREAFEPKRTIYHGTQTDLAEFRDGKHTLIATGSDGEQHAYEPTGVIGVDPLWQYLIPQPGGRLQVTELAYDPAEKEWFNVYREEDRQHWEWGHWSQRGMNWNSMCATCHTTDYRKNYNPKDDAYASTWLELGVGCEACHGPMKAHVEWQGRYPHAKSDPTLRKISRDEYLSICGTCHARRGDLGSRFSPGEAFIEHYEPFLPDHSDVFYPDGQVWDEDFEYGAFRLSAMAHWGVRCMDCHDGHSGKTLQPGNTLCLQCHKTSIGTKRAIDEVEHSHHPPDKAGFLCTDCHMPQTAYMARHWRHDHGFTIPDPVLTKEHGLPNACTRCHKDEGVEWAIEYVEEWYGKLMDRPTRHRARLLARAKEGDFTTADGILAMLQAEQNPAWRTVYLRFLAPMTGRTGATVRESIGAEMLKRLDDESPLAQAAAIEALTPLMPAVAPALTPKLESPYRVVRIKAAWALRGRIVPDSKAGRDLFAWLEYNQDQPAGAFQWANFHADAGRPEAAAEWYDKTVRWDPGSAPFRYNYAVVLAQLGRPYDGIAQLLKASELEPQQALYPYSLGLLYDEIQQPEDARQALRAAVDLEPANPRYWYNLGLAENHLGHVDAALSALRKAEELQPDEPHFPYTRATLHYGQGDLISARQALERVLRIDPTHAGALELMQRM